MPKGKQEGRVALFFGHRSQIQDVRCRKEKVRSCTPRPKKKKNRERILNIGA